MCHLLLLLLLRCSYLPPVCEGRLEAKAGKERHLSQKETNSLQRKHGNVSCNERVSCTASYPQVSFSQKPPLEAHTDAPCHLDL